MAIIIVAAIAVVTEAAITNIAVIIIISIVALVNFCINLYVVEFYKNYFGETILIEFHNI